LERDNLIREIINHHIGDNDIDAINDARRRGGIFPVLFLRKKKKQDLEQYALFIPISKDGIKRQNLSSIILVSDSRKLNKICVNN
jgi:hypothetical protein